MVNLDNEKIPKYHATKISSQHQSKSETFISFNTLLRYADILISYKIYHLLNNATTFTFLLISNIHLPKSPATTFGHSALMSKVAKFKIPKKSDKKPFNILRYTRVGC